ATAAAACRRMRTWKARGRPAGARACPRPTSTARSRCSTRRTPSSGAASEGAPMTRTAIHVDHIARVEGHGNVRVVIEDGIVKTVEMNVVEPARLFESMVRGRRFEEVPYIASRI